MEFGGFAMQPHETSELVLHVDVGVTNEGEESRNQVLLYGAQRISMQHIHVFLDATQTHFVYAMLMCFSSHLCHLFSGIFMFLLPFPSKFMLFVVFCLQAQSPPFALGGHGVVQIWHKHQTLHPRMPRAWVLEPTPLGVTWEFICYLLRFHLPCPLWLIPSRVNRFWSKLRQGLHAQILSPHKEVNMQEEV